VGQCDFEHSSCAALATTAEAGNLIHYRTPDGRAGWTDTAAKLPPGAVIISDRYEPDGQVTRSEPARAPHQWPGIRPAETPSERANAANSTATRELWVARRRGAEREVKLAREEIAMWREMGCSTAKRWSYNSPSRCSSLGDSYLAKAQQRLAAAEEFLGDGLFEECRRSHGCLPGYIR
jgi:hypothetical protein